MFKNRGGQVFALLGLFVLGLGLGLILALGRAPQGGWAPAEDGVGVMVWVGPDGRFSTPHLVQVRGSADTRSFALVKPSEVKGYQLLVWPKAGAWPALALPVGWSAAWVGSFGQVVEVQPGGSGPLVPRLGGRNSLAILGVPQGIECPSLGGKILVSGVVQGEAFYSEAP